MNEILWKPTLSEIEDSQAWEFIQEANIKFNISLENFYDLYTWSCKCPESFWELFWEYSKIIAEKDSKKVLKIFNKARKKLINQTNTSFYFLIS